MNGYHSDGRVQIDSGFNQFLWWLMPSHAQTGDIKMRNRVMIFRTTRPKVLSDYKTWHIYTTMQYSTTCLTIATNSYAMKK